MSEFFSIFYYQKQWLLMGGSFWWRVASRQGQFPSILAPADCPQGPVLLLFVSLSLFFFLIFFYFFTEGLSLVHPKGWW